METGLETFYRFFKRYERVTGEGFYEIVAPPTRSEGEIEPGGDAVLQAVAEHRVRFLEAMDDDFNTGGGVGILFDLVRRLNKFVDDERLEEPSNRAPGKLDVLKRGAAVLCEVSATLGLFRRPSKEEPAGDDELVGKLMDLLIEIRPEGQGLRYGRPDPQLAGRVGDYPGGSAGGDRVECSIAARGWAGNAAKPQAAGGVACQTRRAASWVSTRG